MALSYNSMGIMGLSIALVMYFCNEHHKWTWNVLAGLFLAVAVLCCPYLVVLYLIYSIYAVFKYLKCKNKDYIKDWFEISVGALFLACEFFVVVFRNTSLSQLLTSLSYVLDDPTHPMLSLFEKSKMYVGGVIC